MARARSGSRGRGRSCSGLWGGRGGGGLHCGTSMERRRVGASLLEIHRDGLGEIDARQAGDAGNPGVGQDLVCRKALNWVDDQHVLDQILGIG